MREIYSVAVELGRPLKGQAIIILSVAVVVWLQGVDVLVQDLVWAELLVATESR